MLVLGHVIVVGGRSLGWRTVIGRGHLGVAFNHANARKLKSLPNREGEEGAEPESSLDPAIEALSKITRRSICKRGEE